MISGVLETFENNSMSLSCRACIRVEYGVVTEKSFKGMARIFGDNWVGWYERKNIGDTVTQKEVEHILGFNGLYNVISTWNKDLLYDKDKKF